MPRRRKRSPRPQRGGSDWEAVLPTLDLHGHTADEALRRSERWLRDQQVAGSRTVRLITGRGLRSAGPPVLRGEIEEMLRRLRTGLVEEFTAESAGGAFRVQLRAAARASRRSTQPAVQGLLGNRPELRRRAEEALEEVGVKPTPELLEAEMRRLLREAGDQSA
jgi:hypothetical protein